MNRKGFTLIELLAVIVIIGLIGVLVVPNVLSSVNKSKESSYNILLKNIVTASQTYYEECEYGDLSDTTKYGDYSCEIIKDEETNQERISHAETTLGELANTGFLKVNDKDPNTEIKLVLDPRNNNDMSQCKIKITKKVNKSTFTVTYQINNISTEETCPNTYE